MRKSGRKTRYPGVFQTGPRTFRIYGKAMDPRTGKKRQVERLLEGVSAQEAAVQRAALLDEIRSGGIHNQVAERVKVGDFAKSWIERKVASLSPATADRYVDSLENHVLTELGAFYCDALRSADVQSWVNGKLGEGYKVETVKSWFRVLRTMMRDAMETYDLARDPTRRIVFPDDGEPEDPNALSPKELAAFLEAMRARFPQHYPLVATLAFTGLRFCHASALTWSDIDEEAGVIYIRRSQVRGTVSPVSRKKRAPRRYPLVPELAEILRAHRRSQLSRQDPGLEEGWVFPSRTGGLRNPSSLSKAWPKCLEAAGIERRFTVHGLRRTFNDLARRAGVDAFTARSLTGHVTERMQDHYSTVQIDEQRAALAGVVGLVSVGGMDGGMDATRN